MSDETRKIADGLAVDSRKKMVSCVDLSDLIEKAIDTYGQKRFYEGMRKALDIAKMDWLIDKPLPDAKIIKEVNKIRMKIISLLPKERKDE